MKGVLVLTGGGSEVFGKLLRLGGGSEFFLEGRIPYSKQALEEMVGKVDKACSEKTARKMAMWAFERARELGGHFGVGMTCSLTVENERTGRENHIFAAKQTAYETSAYELVPVTKHRTDQEGQAARLAYNIFKGPVLSTTFAGGNPALFDDELVAVDWDGSPVKTEGTKCVFSGSFNPMHDGHYAIFAEGVKRFGDVVLEISVKNIEKPTLDFIEMKSRPRHAVFTNAMTFAQKCKLFPGATFLMGFDTWKRITDLTCFVQYGCEALVFDRGGEKLENGAWVAKRVEMNIPVSSTEIRSLS